MRTSIKTGALAGALTLALAGPASAAFLPDEAFYDGKTNHGGNLTFKVHNHRITRIKGTLPLPAGGTCGYADERRIPFNFKENDPVDSGPFSIDAVQRVNPGTRDWRKLKMHLEGQFDSDAAKAHGDLHAKVYDRHGKCETRDDLTWHIHRR